MGEISICDNSEFAEISQIIDIEAILAKVKQIDALKAALDSVGKFHENAIRYARLEAAALIRVVELGGIAGLRGYHRKVAEWLSGLSEDERERHIRMCGEGLTIDQVWKREVHDEMKVRQQLDYVKFLRQDIIEEAKSNGIVSLSAFSKSVHDHIEGQMAEDIIDGTRNSLRKMGAVGIGDDNGTYVMPKPENEAYVKQAILTRFDSVNNDLENIMKISKAAKVKMSYKDFGIDFYNADRTSHGYMSYLMIVFDSMGLFGDREEMYTDIQKSGIYNEINWVDKELRVGALKAARMVYQNKLAQSGEVSAQ